MAKKPNRSKTKKTSGRPVGTPKPKQGSELGRYARGILGLLLLTGVVFALGSVLMRQLVINKLQSRILSSASLILSRPTSLSLGQIIPAAALEQKLKRLGYRKTNEAPKRPGQYQRHEQSFNLFLREAVLPDGSTQPEQLAHVSTDGNKVRSLVDIRFQQPIEVAWLEPEVVSQLGDSSSRASTLATLDEFPKVLTDAVLAVEDRRFYDHIGLDFRSIARAVYVNLREGRIVQGGSTITQQLAKNLFFTHRKSFIRKIIEAVSALMIETAYSKDEILELYLNEVFLGQEGRVALHGFGEAARSFFGKEVSALNLAEAATLAGIIKAPSRYSPRFHPKRAKSRRIVALNKMLELDLVTPREVANASKADLRIRKPSRGARKSPYFVDYVRRTLGQQTNVLNEKVKQLRVHTSLDLDYQECAKNAVQSGLAKLDSKGRKGLQGALVSIIPHSGEVRAWVGGRDYGKNQFDRVSQAKRQPGSAFKPFVYLTALDDNLNGYRVARTTNTLQDEPMTLDIPGSTRWSPENYDKKYRGEVTVREALTFSLNVPTVNLAQKVGIDAIADTAESVGFGRDLPRVPSLALGAGEVSPFGLAQAYTSIANGGTLVHLRPMLSVTAAGNNGAILYDRLRESPVAQAASTFVLTDILRSVVEHGTGRNIRKNGYFGPAAGKTGTTNDMRDAWYVGFTPSLLTVVWVGRDDNSPTGLTGGRAAAPIWAEYMKCVSSYEPTLDFLPPPGVVYRRIDLRTGLLATPNCNPRDIQSEVFVEGTEPITSCPLHNRKARERNPWHPEKLIPNKRKNSRNSSSFWDKWWGE